jgi:hypothetical protein
MKIKVILLAFFLSSCATGTKTSQVDSLSFERVRAFTEGTSTENDIVAILGSPTSRTEERGYYTLHYDSPKTGMQRLSLNFLVEGHVLTGLLWIPREGEKEYSLGPAKAGFMNANFKEVINSVDNPHAVSVDDVSYIDEKSGVTIRYDRLQKNVAAIAMYDSNTRLPAEAEKKEKVPFTFSDEPVISK